MIDNLGDFPAKCAREVARDSGSHLDNGFLDFFVITLSLDLILDKEDIVQNLFYTSLCFSLFFGENSDIAVLQEVS